MYVDVIGGFLGSGKTTTILHLLRERAMDPAKTVLLVNEFGKVGVDGALLEGEGGAVRELASGCICCTLKADFMLQIEDIVATYAPEHVVVEPSGVASMRDVLQALTHPRVAHLISELRTVLVLDVDDYDWFVNMSDQFVDAQIGLAQLILLNKTDLAEPEAIAAVTADLERRNPEAVIVPTTYGAFSWETVGPLLAPLPSRRRSHGPARGLRVVLGGDPGTGGRRGHPGVLPGGLGGSLRRRAAGEGCLRRRRRVRAARPGVTSSARDTVVLRRLGQDQSGRDGARRRRPSWALSASVTGSVLEVGTVAGDGRAFGRSRRLIGASCAGRLESADHARQFGRANGRSRAPSTWW